MNTHLKQLLYTKRCWKFRFWPGTGFTLMKNLKRNKLCYFHKLTCSHYAEIISDMNTLARDPVCPSHVALSHIIMQLFIIFGGGNEK